VPTVVDIVSAVGDDQLIVRRKRLTFIPAKSIAADSIRRFEVKCGMALPRDYAQFLSRYGAASYFGARVLRPSDIDAVFRYRERQVGPKTIPATGVILFARVEFLPADERFHFAFVFPCDLMKKLPAPSTYSVRAWAGDASMGWTADAMRSKSFSHWLVNWARLMRRKSSEAPNAFRSR
jgi:hypothetical protein